MTELETATILKGFRDIIREELACFIEPNRIMKLPQAAKFLKVDSGWLREQCKAGLDGAIQIGNGTKNHHYNIDIIKASKALQRKGIYKP
jgi:hypothetical protein